MTKEGMTRREANAFLEWLGDQSADTLMKMCVFFFKAAAKKYAEERP